VQPSGLDEGAATSNNLKALKQRKRPASSLDGKQQKIDEFIV
jgi:hypothetical protein